ncbi:TPA: ABC transporter permease subunit [Candidatus Bipolaricaulota bacterium]|nr:ABC transporter permease subunit [Candidatus Bipolaricaulota bacterium]HIP99774.1 ABC transporter permease subunit [Candidatus Bipolaricaulota bacterium]
MPSLLSAVSQAFSMIVSLDSYLLSVVGVSLRVSGMALVISVPLSALVAALLGLARFPGRNLLRTLVNTGMGVPSVIVGLVVLLLLSRSGPFGGLGLLWTPTAMVISQCVLITPLITGVMLSALVGVDRAISEAAHALGASRLQRVLTVIREARFGFLTAVIAGFGRAISEVGSVLLVGGNIVFPHGVSYTRTLTTAIVVETRKGQFETALALGIVLIVIVLSLNLLASRLQRRGSW